jgi:hypothetical protein
MVETVVLLLLWSGSSVRLSDLADFLVFLLVFELCSLFFAADVFDFILIVVGGKIALLMLKLPVSGIVLPSYPDGI